MVPIDCGDDVEVRVGPGEGVAIDCQWTSESRESGKSAAGEAFPQTDVIRTGVITDPPSTPLPNDSSNLAVAAAECFLDHFGIRASVDIKIRKRTPSGAGMGGASSDAAAVLRCLKKAFEHDSLDAGDHLDPIDPIDSIAASIGSDVPFFLHPQAARATGRGEILQPFNLPAAIDFVVIHPSIGLSTAAVYGRNEIPVEPESPAALIEYLTNFDAESQSDRALPPPMLNRLTRPAIELCPSIGRLLDALRTAAPDRHHAMTGSGSACFAILRNCQEAAQTAQYLRNQSSGDDWIGHFRSRVDPGLVFIR